MLKMNIKKLEEKNKQMKSLLEEMPSKQMNIDYMQQIGELDAEEAQNKKDELYGKLGILELEIKTLEEELKL